MKINKIISLILVVFSILTFMVGCEKQTSNKDMDYSIEIQFDYYAEKAHFYRINQDGVIEYSGRDGSYGNLYYNEPKGYEYINFDSTSGKVGLLSKESLKQLEILVKDIACEKSDYSAVDTPQLHIYYNDTVFGCCILKDKKIYDKIDKLLDFLNENTSIKLDRNIY